MTYTPQQFLALCDTALSPLGLSNDGANYLLLGTCSEESSMGANRRQFNCTGLVGAFGIMGIQLNALALVRHYLDHHNPNLLAAVEKLYQEDVVSDNGIHTYTPTSVELDCANLQYNDPYAVAIARCLYYSIQVPLPDFDDIEAQAGYWKRWYNRSPNGGTTDDFIHNYNTLVAPYL